MTVSDFTESNIRLSGNELQREQVALLEKTTKSSQPTKLQRCHSSMPFWLDRWSPWERHDRALDSATDDICGERLEPPASASTKRGENVVPRVRAPFRGLRSRSLGTVAEDAMIELKFNTAKLFVLEGMFFRAC